MQRLVDSFQALLASRFVQKAGVLTVATLIAQVLTLANLVLLARTFSQDTLGLFYVYQSYVVILGTVCLLSYQQALPTAYADELHALICGCGISLLAVAGLSGVAAWYFGYPYFIALAVGVLAVGVLLLVEMLCVRLGQVAHIAVLRVLTAALLLGLTAALWYGDRKTERGLIYGTAVLSLVAAIPFGWSALSRSSISWPGIRKISAVLIRRKNNPLMQMPAELMNAMTYQLPVTLIERGFGAPMAAQYAVVLKSCSGVIQLLGNSIAKVFFGRISEMRREQSAETFLAYRLLRNRMIWLSLLTALVILTVLPPVLVWVLGKDWGIAAEFARVLAPMYGFMLLALPLNMLFLVFEQQRYLLYSQVIYLASSLASFLLAIWLENLWVGMIMFSALSCLRYGFMIHRANIAAQGLKQPLHR